MYLIPWHFCCVRGMVLLLQESHLFLFSYPLMIVPVSPEDGNPNGWLQFNANCDNNVNLLLKGKLLPWLYF